MATVDEREMIDAQVLYVLRQAEDPATMSDIIEALGRKGEQTAAAIIGKSLKHCVQQGWVQKVLTDDERRAFAITVAGMDAQPRRRGEPQDSTRLLDRLPDGRVRPTDMAPPTRPERRPSEHVTLPPDVVQRMTPQQARQYRSYMARRGEGDWSTWLPAMFPAMCTAPFGAHHAQLWEWVWDLETGVAPEPFVGIWNRGGAKSSSAEMAVAAIGCLGLRRYAVYVTGTQELADDHVGTNIGGLLEGDTVAASYPLMASRAVSKYGVSKGWRRNRLTTASGFIVDALGLDTGIRGIRMGDQRPDLIIIDDIDDEADTRRTIEKKVSILTRRLLPAGSQDCAVIFIQNKMHSQSIAARLISHNQPGEPERADWLSGRIVSGPIPAVWSLEISTREGGEGYEIVSGEPSWEGMDIESCQIQIDRFGLSSFMVECQHEDADLKGGMFDHLPFEDMEVTEEELPAFEETTCWVDPAVSATDRSDSCGIQIDGLGVDGVYYRLYSWEQVADPLTVMKRALRKAIEWQCEVLGVETDQGGETWRVVYTKAIDELNQSIVTREDDDTGEAVDVNELEWLLTHHHARLPRFESAKAGASQMSKTERAGLMLVDYERPGKIKHLAGATLQLKRALRRFPRHKPLDLADAAYWSWRWLARKGDPGRRFGYSRPGQGGTSTRRKQRGQQPRGPR